MRTVLLPTCMLALEKKGVQAAREARQASPLQRRK